MAAGTLGHLGLSALEVVKEARKIVIDCVIVPLRVTMAVLVLAFSIRPLSATNSHVLVCIFC